MVAEGSRVMAVRERLDPLHLALEQGEDGRAVDLLSGLGSAEVAALLESLDAL